MEIEKGIKTMHFDIQLSICCFLNVEDILALSQTSKKLRQDLKRGCFWKSLFASYGEKVGIRFTNLEISENEYYNLLKMIWRPLSHSGLLKLEPLFSTSNDYNQSIDKTLIYTEQVFWSSKGSDSEDANEYLIYLFDEFFCLPKKVVIEFYTADGYIGPPLEFRSKHIRVDFSIDGNNWEYESQIVESNHHKVEIDLKGRIGIARYMKVNFLGKIMRQPGDELYYHAVENVQCFGLKLDKRIKQSDFFILDGYFNWLELRIDDKTKNKDCKLEVELYYLNQKFDKAQDEQFISILQNKDNFTIWEHIIQNKYLLRNFNTFTSICKYRKDFIPFYLETKCTYTKCDSISHFETLLVLFRLFENSGIDNINISQNPSELVNFLQNCYESVDLTWCPPIKYFQLSKSTIIQMRELKGLKIDVLFKYWEEKNMGTSFRTFNLIALEDNPTDFAEHELRVLMINMLIFHLKSK